MIDCPRANLSPFDTLINVTGGDERPRGVGDARVHRWILLSDERSLKNRRVFRDIERFNRNISLVDGSRGERGFLRISEDSRGAMNGGFELVLELAWIYRLLVVLINFGGEAPRGWVNRFRKTIEFWKCRLAWGSCSDDLIAGERYLRGN